MKLFFSQFVVFSFIALVLAPLPTLASSVREQEVRAAITTFVKDRTANMGWDVTLRKVTISDALKLPEGVIEYEVVAPQQWEGWGSVNVSVNARQNDRVVRNFAVRVEVEALVDMVVTLRQIDHGAIISPEDVVLKKREISHNNNLMARNIDEVVGKKMRSGIRANQPVRSDMLEKVPLVKSGQMVTIVAENETMKISVSGKARNSGAAGDIIRVQNLNSLKEISARVISATTVQVAF